MKKLTLAGRGDIKRIFDRMDEAREEGPVRNRSIESKLAKDLLLELQAIADQAT